MRLIANRNSRETLDSDWNLTYNHRLLEGDGGQMRPSGGLASVNEQVLLATN